MISFVLLTSIITYIIFNIVLRLVQNKKAHRFFQENSKGLTVLPSPSIFTGNLFETTWNPRNWHQLEELHRKYGKTYVYYILHQPWLSTKDLDLVKLVMEKHHDRAYLGTPYKALNESIFQVNGDKWRRLRRAVGPTMTNFKVRGEAVTSDVQDIVNQLRKALINKASKAEASGESSFEIDANHMAKRYTLAVILFVTYKRNHLINFESERDVWVDDLSEGFKVVTNPIALIAAIFPFILPLISILIHFHKFGHNLDKIVQFTEKAADLQDAAGKRKLLDTTSQNMDKETARQLRKRLADEITETYLTGKLSYEELQGTLLLFIIAGYETVAATVSNLTWQLAQHPEIQEKLRASISESGIDSEYLFWCILESLRWFPPVPLGAGRVINYDIEYNGCMIPKGTFVMPSIYSIHHDAEIWPEPERFMPERWANQNDFHPAAFVPFGMGARNCVGGKLAIHEIKLVFQMLLNNYRIERCEATPHDYKFISPVMFITEVVDKITVRLVPLKPENC